MIEEKQEISSEKETGRLEAFSDGVFAVAITLLVFNLNVPAIGKETTSGQLAQLIANDWPSYATFCISFATVLIMWVSHHNMFKLIQRSNTLFMFANGFLLLLVTVVPFTSRLLATCLMLPTATFACAAYAGLFLTINIAYNMLWWSAAHRHHLLRSDVPTSLIKIRTRSYLLGFPSYLLAVVLAFPYPFVSIGICSVLWLFWAYTSYERTLPIQEPLAT